ncbi:hypothetical protein [Microcoleus sp. FACHB-672]|uniref:hypothetical protein n=1 Tax=Microcoleus sp. FACHB-672 TaxID=2692825 RepID=UPI001F5572B5|nr:hypothetical protein [Microcoleus sp. FACHB-672]
MLWNRLRDVGHARTWLWPNAGITNAHPHIKHFQRVHYSKLNNRQRLFVTKSYMNVIGVSIAISFLMTGLSQALLPALSLSEPLAEQQLFFLSSKLNARSSAGSQSWLSLKDSEVQTPIENVLENQCQKEPVGVGIPGFKPGTPKSHVRQMFGRPSRTVSGYWPNTTAMIYDLIPEKVSLGFLFDTNSEYLRQTEASFANSVEFDAIQITLNSMLGCRLNEQIKLGLQLVQQGQSSRYFFFLETLKGVIERDDRQRIYIGIWEADLH